MHRAPSSDIDRGRRDDLSMPTISRFLGIVIAMSSTTTSPHTSTPAQPTVRRRFGSTPWR